MRAFIFWHIIFDLIYFYAFIANFISVFACFNPCFASPCVPIHRAPWVLVAALGGDPLLGSFVGPLGPLGPCSALGGAHLLGSFTGPLACPFQQEGQEVSYRGSYFDEGRDL